MGGFGWMRRGLRRVLDTAEPGRKAAEEPDEDLRVAISTTPIVAAGGVPQLTVVTSGVPVVTSGVPVVAPHPSVSSRDDADVPRGLRIATAWAWRLIVLAGTLALLLWLIGRLRTVLIPISIALLLSALLSPAVGFLRRRLRMPGSLATALVLVGGLTAVIGTLTLVVSEFVDGYPTLADSIVKGVDNLQNWLKEGPAHLSNQQLNDGLAALQNWVQDNRGTLTSSAVSTATATIEFVSLFFLVLFTMFFFLRDGRKIWAFLVGMLPRSARGAIGSAGDAAWRTLVSYVRATVFVAFIDALGIGVSLLVLKVEFVFPLAALVFLAAFVPIVGATVSGSVAVVIALVTKGPWVALLLLLAVIAVQQLEGHVLQPIIMGRAVAVHPLAVILAISTGMVLAGIIGALIAVPILAMLNTGIRHMVHYLTAEREAREAAVAAERAATADK